MIRKKAADVELSVSMQEWLKKICVDFNFLKGFHKNTLLLAFLPLLYNTIINTLRTLWEPLSCDCWLVDPLSHYLDDMSCEVPISK